MRKERLRSKIHRATVTEANLEYKGSLTLGRNLLDASGIEIYDRIQVVNVSNGERLETYVIEGGDGELHLNGAAARLGDVGDVVIVIAYGVYGEGDEVNPVLVHVDENNRVLDIG